MTINGNLLKKLSLPIVACLFVAAAAAAGINFAGGKITSIAKQIEKQRMLAATLRQREQAITAITADFGKVGPYEEKFDRAQPAVDNLLPFISAVDGLGKKYGLAASLTLSPPAVLTADQNGKATFNVGFSIALNRITAEQLSDYLREFDALPYFAGIDSLSAFSSDAGGWQDAADIKLSGKLYAKN